uniref:Uncharacterized protein n=1 Tax=Ditylenchus dipsaci TaxID=166011 RepID=A0A915EL68_9BILA
MGARLYLTNWMFEMWEGSEQQQPIQFSLLESNPMSGWGIQENGNVDPQGWFMAGNVSRRSLQRQNRIKQDKFIENVTLCIQEKCEADLSSIQTEEGICLIIAFSLIFCFSCKISSS